MKIIEARNVHDALPQAVKLLKEHGIKRESRNGPVLIAPWPVTTIYAKPVERVIFWQERDANPYFHLYEALWMLAGRNDIVYLSKFAKNIANYSDDGTTQHGAYGHRWRKAFGYDDNNEPDEERGDQLKIIAERLRKDPDDRRCVLQMWDTRLDLGVNSKDLPCNTMATFQRDQDGKLDLTVFCRSNDIVWGAYGANAVHFSVLLEYMANWIGCPVGVYRQISVNWHAYLDTFKTVEMIINGQNPYQYGVKPTELPKDTAYCDKLIKEFLLVTDVEFANVHLSNDDEPFFNMAHTLMRAHQAWRSSPGIERYAKALEILLYGDNSSDWIIAARHWMLRREQKALHSVA